MKKNKYKDMLLRWIYFPENDTNIPDAVIFIKRMTKKEVKKQYPEFNDDKYIVLDI